MIARLTQWLYNELKARRISYTEIAERVAQASKAGEVPWFGQPAISRLMALRELKAGRDSAPEQVPSLLVILFIATEILQVRPSMLLSVVLAPERSHASNAALYEADEIRERFLDLQTPFAREAVWDALAYAARSEQRWLALGGQEIATARATPTASGGVSPVGTRITEAPLTTAEGSEMSADAAAFYDEAQQLEAEAQARRERTERQELDGTTTRDKTS